MNCLCVGYRQDAREASLGWGRLDSSRTLRKSGGCRACRLAYINCLAFQAHLVSIIKHPTTEYSIWNKRCGRVIYSPRLSPTDGV